jgi:shikimate dehydrogenase
LKREGARWLAANTDRVGFLAALEKAAPELLARGRSALVLGAGGVARTAVATLREHGLDVTIASRTDARASALAKSFGAATTSWDELDATRFDLVVNATPVGMQPDVERSPLPDGALRAGQVVFDLVYRPRETRLLAQARRAGARAIDGLGMFLAQALAQFSIFTGRAGDEELARATVEGRA